MSVQVVFWYSEEIVYKGYFTAENEDQAKELLKKVDDCEISFDDLPEFFSKTKSFETTLDNEPQFYPIKNEKPERTINDIKRELEESAL